MYQHILVTLDESELAEQALPHAVALARAFGSTLHLVSVVAVTSPEALQIATMATDHEAQLDSARAYMRGIRKRAIEEGVETEWDVCQGDVADEILRYREQQDCDLIVMSTHGRSGMGRWVYGSVADRILRHSPVPVLLVRATESA
ncbi:MAG: universal stress protein [Armatimonadetes bacterium]|jgi:nucleotide-binding universal stress UspA family protein|nr:universal stress protein [Armatimonadota bacterium]MDI9586077.1 universal stress protein [Acidobacteriota bacterium]